MKQKKILLIKLGAIGDVVHTTIIPLAIKTKHPDWEIHYMTSPTIAPILRNIEYIDKVIEFQTDKTRRYKQLFETTKALFKERYNIIFCLAYTLRLYIMAFGAFPNNVAFRSYKGKSWIENYFYTAKNVISDLELPKRLVLQNNPEKENIIKKELEKYPKPYIIFNPGNNDPRRRQGRVWNIEKWKELAQKIEQKYGGTIFVTGHETERAYQSQIAGNNVQLLSGKYCLEDSCVILSLMDLVISGDSGPVHIASAFNVKTLAILGSTSAEKIKPYGENGHFIEPKTDCKYCWKKRCKLLKEGEVYTPCIESISVEDVMNEIAESKLL